jgi:hypothetical protein
MTEARGVATFGVALGLMTLAARSRAAEGPGDTQTLPCRPTIACTADFVPPGAFELEAGYQYRRLAGNQRQSSFPFLAKLTLDRWVQAQVGSNGYTAVQGPTALHYFDNVSLGAKLHFFDQGRLMPSVSFSAAVSVPTVADPGYVRATDLLAIAYVTKDVGPIHADFNVGWNQFGGDSGALSQQWVALALSASLPAPFGVMVENYYFTDAAPLASRDGGALFAVSHAPRPWLTFDLGGDVGYFPGTRAFSAFFGMSIVPFLVWNEQ